MAHLLIVGDNNCSFNSLAIAISKCPTHADVLDKWKELAKHLNTDEVKKRELQQNLNLGTKKIKCIPYELMFEWRSINGNAATLEWFCEALKATGLNSTATHLLEHFVPTKMVDSEKSTSSTESACASAIRSLKKEDDIPITEEGRRLKEYVQYYIIDLIEMTDLSDDLIRVMTDNGVLEDKDIENINRSRFPEDKVKRFYQIILEKISMEPDIYEKVLSGFMADERHRERGIADIFERFYD